MTNIMTPIMSCWQPPINACVTPSRPLQRTPPVMVSPVVDRYRQGSKTEHIRDPHANDVLCGRGGSSNRHVGNLNFRSLVSANKEMYVTLTKKQKMMVARKIVETIHGQEPPGRFLQKDLNTGTWFDIGLPRSLEKTSQALREKASTGLSSPDDALSDVGTDVDTDVGTDVGTDPGTDPGCHSPTPVSPQSTGHSSPVASSASKSKPIVEIPDICIPQHLTAQFSPHTPVVDSHPPRHGLPPASWDYGPTPSQPYLHHYPPPPDSVYSHYHQPRPTYSSGPPPSYDHHRDYRHVYRQPYPQAYPPQAYHSRHAPAPYPPVTSSGPPPSSHYHSAHPIPSSPERHHSYRLPPPTTPVLSSSRNGSQSGHPSKSSPGPMPSTANRASREKVDVSPGRAQLPKKPRHHSPLSNAAKQESHRSSSSSHNSASSLSRDMQNRLTFHDHSNPMQIGSTAHAIISPTSLSQSRVSVRRSASKDSRSNPLSGLAALSSAALMKLDEGEKKD